MHDSLLENGDDRTSTNIHKKHSDKAAHKSISYVKYKFYNKYSNLKTPLKFYLKQVDKQSYFDGTEIAPFTHSHFHSFCQHTSMIHNTHIQYTVNLSSFLHDFKLFIDTSNTKQLQSQT